MILFHLQLHRHNLEREAPKKSINSMIIKEVFNKKKVIAGEFTSFFVFASPFDSNVFSI